jgi:hypothetical protein
MMTRRAVVTGAMLAGVADVAAGDPGPTASIGTAAAAADDQIPKVLGEIRDELKGMRTNPCNASDCPEVDKIRLEQRTFTKARNKFPDFIDVGVEIWERVSDWHVRHIVPIQVVRMLDGRYGMLFFQTTLVLRPDMMNTFIGQGYDR